MKLYHGTAKVNRGSIKRHGLIPRNTGDWNHPGVGEYQGGPAVYAEQDPFHAFGWGKMSKRAKRDRYQDADVWEIDATGLPIERDKLIREATRILTKVPPDRIRLLDPDELAKAA